MLLGSVEVYGEKCLWPKIHSDLFNSEREREREKCNIHLCLWFPVYI